MPKQTFLNLPDEKQSRILDCAVDEFAEYGFDKASITRIVEASGIAKGSFYQYFEDKEDLYELVISRMLVEQKLRISAKYEGQLEQLTLTEFLRVLFRAMLEEFSHQPKIIRVSMDFIRHPNEAVYKRIEEKYRGMRDQYYQAFILREKAHGEIDPNVNADVLAAMLLGLSYQLADWLVLHGKSDCLAEYGEHIDKMLDRVDYILTNGIYRNTEQEVRP